MIENRASILKTEFSEEFVYKMKNRMATSYFKYGPIADNYGKGLVDSIKNAEIRLQKFRETGNLEFLVDVANQAMIEFMFPQHPNTHFDSEKHGTRLEGMTIKDLEEFKEEY